MKGTQLVSVMLAMTIVITAIAAVTTIALLLLQTAQAFPCNGNNGKEYCNGYDRGYSDEEDFLG
jgi:hypothetical protein